MATRPMVIGEDAGPCAAARASVSSSGAADRLAGQDGTANGGGQPRLTRHFASSAYVKQVRDMRIRPPPQAQRVKVSTRQTLNSFMSILLGIGETARLTPRAWPPPGRA